jgi:hypothetical protein
VKKLRIKKATILGAATMGAQLAACFANAGIPAYLFYLTQNNTPLPQLKISFSLFYTKNNNYFEWQ